MFCIKAALLEIILGIFSSSHRSIGLSLSASTLSLNAYGSGESVFLGWSQGLNFSQN